MDFLVYEHWRPDQDICFYVGKGKGRRSENVSARNRLYAGVLSELAAAGMCVEVRMVASGLAEQEAFRIECNRIAFWRSTGVALVNLTDGGEGWSGFVRPLGIPLSEASGQKLSAARKGMKFTDEHRAKLAANKIGKPRKPFTEETRAKMRLASAEREAEKRRRFGPNVRRGSRIKETS